MNKLKKQIRLEMAKGKHLSCSRHGVTLHHPLHWHSYFELEIILSGSGKYIINDVAYDICENNVFLLTPTDFHYLEVDGTVELLNISFDEEMIDEKDIVSLVFPETKKAYIFNQDEHERIVKAGELLNHEYVIGGNCQKQILQYVLNCIFRKNEPHHSSYLGDGYYHGIKKAIVYMQMHFKEKITLEALAKEAGYHPTYFSELFKSSTGENYISSLNKLRVGYARTLLANGFSVSDSCFLSGFGSLSNFGDIFKKYCNMSPSEYAKASRK
ncbi:MAG: helix-turn-helix domain-containing protein [Clostridia bacterium]|nr:helix-turn-helix domain-containing protein [Clostridia bacterium]